MKYHFKNIGPIKNATIELGDLTILAGPNNTGKTYITYTLYGFLQTGHQYFSMDDAVKKIIQELNESGHAKLDLRDLDFNKIFSVMTKQYSSHLHEIFNARKEEFQHAEFSIEMNNPLTILLNDKDKLKHLAAAYNTFNLPAIISVLEENICLIFNFQRKEKANTLNDEFVDYRLAAMLADILHYLFFLNPYICVSERLGIPIFYRGLDIQKIEFVEQFQKLTDDNKTGGPLASFLEMQRKIIPQYVLPVKDNIDFVRSIPHLITEDSLPEIAALNDYITLMTGGVYSHHPVAGLVFSSKPSDETNQFSLTSNLWSSSVKSLSSLFFYLQHRAEPGHLLIIDEPEIHLTPQNQIILARMLAACVNQGIKVLITTHSDYLIKEFNNLIMLHKLSEKGRATFMERGNAPYKVGEMLNPAQVKAYVCQDGGVVPCYMDQYGMSVTSMDEAINEMNTTAYDLIDQIDRENV